MQYKLFYLVLIAIVTKGCYHNDFKLDDLPSHELIDSVIIASIKLDSLNIYYLDDYEKDSMRKDSIPFNCYDLHSTLKEWHLFSDTNIVEILSDRNVFDFSYITKAILRQNGFTLFNLEDSAFMSFQIAHKYPDTLNLKQLQKVTYINDFGLSTINQLNNHNSLDWVRYIQFSQPLFNKNRSIAIIGVSLYDYKSNRPQQYKGGYYLILKREHKDWIEIADLDWWGN
jgi:hypothetical protein